MSSLRQTLLGLRNADSAGTSSLAPAYLLAATRLISAILLSVILARLMIKVPNGSSMLPACACALELIAFYLLFAASCLATAKRNCVYLTALTGLIHQCGASLALTVLIIAPYYESSRSMIDFSLGAAIPAVVFLVDSVVLIADLHHPLITAFIPVAMGTAGFFADGELVRTCAEKLEADRIRLVMLAASWSLSGTILAAFISRLGVFLLVCRHPIDNTEVDQSSDRENENAPNSDAALALTVV